MSLKGIVFKKGPINFENFGLKLMYELFRNFQYVSCSLTPFLSNGRKKTAVKCCMFPFIQEMTAVKRNAQ